MPSYAAFYSTHHMKNLIPGRMRTTKTKGRDQTSEMEDQWQKTHRFPCPSVHNLPDEWKKRKKRKERPNDDRIPVQKTSDTSPRPRVRKDTKMEKGWKHLP